MTKNLSDNGLSVQAFPEENLCINVLFTLRHFYDKLSVVFAAGFSKRLCSDIFSGQFFCFDNKLL